GAEIKHRIAQRLQELQALVWEEAAPPQWRAGAAQLLRERHELMRIERRDADGRIVDALDAAMQPPLFSRIPRAGLSIELELACPNARRVLAPSLSRSYFVPRDDGIGFEVVDVCVPLVRNGQAQETLVATVGLGALLESAFTPEQARTYELSFVEGD